MLRIWSAGPQDHTRVRTSSELEGAANGSFGRSPFVIALPKAIALYEDQAHGLSGTSGDAKGPRKQHGKRILAELKKGFCYHCGLPKAMLEDGGDFLRTTKANVCQLSRNELALCSDYAPRLRAFGVPARVEQTGTVSDVVGCGQTFAWPDLTYDDKQQCIGTTNIGDFVEQYRTNMEKAMRKILGGFHNSEALFRHLVPSSTSLRSCITFNEYALTDTDSTGAYTKLGELLEAINNGDPQWMQKAAEAFVAVTRNCTNTRTDRSSTPLSNKQLSEKAKNGEIGRNFRPVYDGVRKATYAVACGYASLPGTHILISRATARSLSSWVSVDAPHAVRYLEEVVGVPRMRNGNKRWVEHRDHAVEVYMPVMSGEIVGVHRHPVLLSQNVAIAVVTDDGPRLHAVLGTDRVSLEPWAVGQSEREQANAKNGDFDGDQTKVTRLTLREQRAAGRVTLANQLWRPEHDDAHATELNAVETNLVVLNRLIGDRDAIGPFVAFGLGLDPALDGYRAIRETLVGGMPLVVQDAVMAGVTRVTCFKKRDVQALLRRLHIACFANPLTGGDASLAPVRSEQGFFRLVHRYSLKRPPGFLWTPLRIGEGSEDYDLFWRAEAKGKANPVVDAPQRLVHHREKNEPYAEQYEGNVFNNRASKKNLGPASNMVREINERVIGMLAEPEGYIRFRQFFVGWTPPARDYLDDHYRIIASWYVIDDGDFADPEGLLAEIYQRVGPTWLFDPTREETETRIRMGLRGLRLKLPDAVDAIVKQVHYNYACMVNTEIPRLRISAAMGDSVQMQLDRNKKMDTGGRTLLIIDPVLQLTTPPPKVPSWTVDLAEELQGNGLERWWNAGGFTYANFLTWSERETRFVWNAYWPSVFLGVEGAETFKQLLLHREPDLLKPKCNPNFEAIFANTFVVAPRLQHFSHPALAFRNPTMASAVDTQRLFGIHRAEQALFDDLESTGTAPIDRAYKRLFIRSQLVRGTVG